MSSASVRVIAVVVTYNKLEYLKRCVDALRKQTLPLAEIIVVDNLSNDGTRQWLDGQTGLHVMHLEKNSGGAGGFYAGMREACRQSVDWIWLMDDDTEATPEALQHLMEEARQRPLAGFFNSLVLWSDGRPCRMNIPPAVWEWPDDLEDSGRKVMRIGACSFVSCLVNAAYVPRIGFPVAEFFIWFDDFEYTQRLAAKAPGYLVLDSKVHHYTGENRGVDWSTVTPANYWKYSYGIRNESSFIFHAEGSLVQRICRLLARWAEIYSFLRAGRVKWFLRFKLFRKALLGAWWDYRRNIVYPEARAGEESLDFVRGRLSHRRYKGQTWDAAYGNDLFWQVHPPHPAEKEDKPVALEFADLRVPAGSFFRAGIFLTDRRAGPVRFTAELMKGGQVICRETRALPGGGSSGNLELSFPPEAGTDPLCLRVFTEMEAGAEHNAFCSAFWISPTIERRG